MNVHFYKNGEADMVRSMIEPMFEAMLTRTPCADFVAGDLFDLSREGRAIIGVVFEDSVPVMVGAFEFRCYPRQLAVNIMALGGSKMAEAMDEFWKKFCDWCRNAGAQRIEASCADAMLRLLQRVGFEHTSSNVMYTL